MPAPTTLAPGPAPRTTRRGPGLVCVGVLAALVAVLGLLVGTGQLAVARVTTGSMAPAVPAGSLVVGRPVHSSGLVVGDLLTARVPAVGGTVTHRVVALSRSGGSTLVRTQGDANAAPDPWTTALPAEGATRVVAAVPRLGHVLGRGPGGVPRLMLPLLVLVLTWSGCRWLLRVLREVP